MNKHRDTADFKLTKNKATGKIVVAGSKPAPTTLMLIPMPIDPRAKEELAATLSENNATLLPSNSRLRILLAELSASVDSL